MYEEKQILIVLHVQYELARKNGQIKKPIPVAKAVLEKIYRTLIALTEKNKSGIDLDNEALWSISDPRSWG